MEPLYVAIVLYNNRKYEKCAAKCTIILDIWGGSRAAWALKVAAETAQVRLDELEVDGADGAADLAGNSSPWSEVLASAPRPGTSLRHPTTAATALRRPGAHTPTPGKSRTRTARTPGTARTPSTARSLLATARARSRLGTAAAAHAGGEPLVDAPRLDLSKEAWNITTAKTLFEYLFYHDGDYRNAMELAVHATQGCSFSDWYWKVALGRCYAALGLGREAEQQLRSAMRQQRRPDTCLRLARACVRRDQPATALEVCRGGEQVFSQDIGLLVEQARLLEALGDLPQSVRVYRQVAVLDAMNTESISSIAVHHFYNDQAEMALRYYRRVLAMGAYSAEVLTNVGLCCLRAQHWDLTGGCFRRALLLAIEPTTRASLWYNLSHLALAIGDVNLAVQCLRLCVGVDPSYAAALNNLAVLERRRARAGSARGLLAAALSADPGLPEACANLPIIESC